MITGFIVKHYRLLLPLIWVGLGMLLSVIYNNEIFYYLPLIFSYGWVFSYISTYMGMKK